MTMMDYFEMDWSRAVEKASRYSKDKIDWWLVKEESDGVTYTIIGEDTDGDGRVDFIHADTEGSGRIDFSAYLREDEWVMTNLIEAWLEVNFSLPWSRSSYKRHNVDIFFNETRVASFIDELPEGHYCFPIPPRAIYFPQDKCTENRIQIKSEHLRGGHYVVNNDFQILYRMTEVDTFLVAGTREEAEKKVYDTPGFRYKGFDLSVNSNDISISKQGELAPGEKVEITANICNLGMDPAKDVVVALLQSPVESGSSIRAASVTIPEVSLYGSQKVRFEWTAVPGEQCLQVVIDPDNILEDNSCFNNKALLVVRVSGKDTPPQLEIKYPEEGKKYDNPVVRLEGQGLDESGISRMEYRVDGGLWIERKGTDKISEDISIQPGSHTIFFRAVDCAGNQAEASRNIVVSY